MSLFKTKEEKRAYAIGRNHQYNKEHPMMNYVVRATHYSFNNDGSLFGKPYCVDHDTSRYKTYSEAKKSCDEANKKQSYRKALVLDAIKKRKVNVNDSYEFSYTDYSVVRQKKRI